VRIGDYHPSQARALVELWRASFEHGVGIKDHHPIEEQLAHFVDRVAPTHSVRVVTEGSRLVAFMASTPDSISHLYVRVACLGQGIGSKLVELAKTESSGGLWLFTFAQNRNARRFYEHRGLAEIERESENMWKLEAIRYSWVRNKSAT